MKKRLAAILLSLSMVLTLIPAAAFAAGMQSGTASLTVNQSKVAFAGHEWRVIGDGTSGVYPQEGHITLLAANLDQEFQNVRFRTSGGYNLPNSKWYSGIMYYVNNPSGMSNWTTPNEYAGSILQQKMVEIANSFPTKEQAVITERDLASGADSNNNWSSGKSNSEYLDGIAGQGISDQKLWAISYDEAKKTINDTAVLSFGSNWWLRSPYTRDGASVWFVYSSGNININSVGNWIGNAARPALSLNLESVLFTSDASETGGKSTAAVGSGLIGMEGTSGTIKFTMQDSSQTLTVNATASQSTQTGSTLSFTYSNATTGRNQYVSCVLTDTDGNVKYYGKLADSSSAASGNLSVPLAGVENGTYTLQIFSEEANGYLYTDFCSQPVTMTVTVSDGFGTVSNFGGTVLHEHNWSTEWSSDDDYHWHECAADNCPVTDNSQKDGYAAHSYDQQVVSDTYLESAATCTAPAKYYCSCVCGAKGTETFENGDALGHSWGSWQSNGDGTHTRICQNCNDEETENCSGGTATCQERATCSACGNAYGALGEHTLIEHVHKEPTCTELGNQQYWECSTCHALFSDAEGSATTTMEDITIAQTGHDWDKPVWDWSDDGKTASAIFTCQNDSAHTQSLKADIISEVKKSATCTEAGMKVCTAKVTFNETMYSDQKDVEVSPLGHSMQKTDRVDATCTAPGKAAYFTCETCGKHFEDEAGNTEITDLDEYGIIPAAGHKVGTAWESDESGHWNECVNCGDRMNETDHTFEWVIDKEATATEAGLRHEECTVCGYAKAAVEIPVAGTTGDDPTGNTDSTKTGDDSDAALIAAVALMAAAGAAGALIYRGRRKES